MHACASGEDIAIASLEQAAPGTTHFLSKSAKTVSLNKSQRLCIFPVTDRNPDRALTAVAAVLVWSQISAIHASGLLVVPLLLCSPLQRRSQLTTLHSTCRLGCGKTCSLTGIRQEVVSKSYQSIVAANY